MRDNRHFQRFQSPTFKCMTCMRMTRDTGQGVDHLCEDCYELAGMDNHCNDNAETFEQAGYGDEIERRLAKIAKLGGDTAKVVAQNDFLFAGYTRPIPAAKPKAPKVPKAKPAKPVLAFMVPVVESTSAAIVERTEEFLKAAQIMVNAREEREFPNSPRTALTMTMGGRYAKISSRSGSSGSVWAFIDMTTGDILKAASWRAPAKGVRGTVLAANYGVECCGPYGPRYL